MCRLTARVYMRHADCRRELDAAVAQKKPLCLVYDPVRGGAPLHEIEDECAVELRLAIFGPPHAKRDVIGGACPAPTTLIVCP